MIAASVPLDVEMPAGNTPTSRQALSPMSHPPGTAPMEALLATGTAASSPSATTAEEAGRSLLVVLDNRGSEVPSEARECITECADVDQPKS